ncbi:uncharacterized protein N7496_001952 [Penicillium cataractarum]|uniref:F-box domain-containing protein n=1 Tax=Penicillium cataractarum TaxID=2100454 RepID=A0A9W9VXD5_9EURO|nr:uncharacterized protein N7496_001952 [Penicillium cataractarum]KAJ5390884.1 hypothetical protein N7496_001952 [Penicillium cataractarum]
MAPGGRPKSSRPVRSTRTQVKTYHEDSTSAEDSGLEQTTRDTTSQPPSVSLRPRTSSGTRRSYRESSDTDSEGSFDDNDASVPDAHHLTPPSENPHSSTHSASASTTAPPRDTGLRRHRERDGPPRRSQPKRNTTNPRKSSRRTLGQPLKKRTRIDVSEEVSLTSGVIPPWSTLPYHVLFDIFLRASHPLVDEQLMQRTKSTKWLLDMALLCRQFLEPALAALYYSPPLIPASKSFELLWLLSKPQESLSINYAVKVKELHVDAESVLLYKTGPQLGWFDLCDLIATVPRVHTMRLFHKDDSIVGVPAYSLPVSKWLYPERLFSSIDENGVALRKWDWNGRFIADIETLLPFMLEKHQRAAFQQLKHLRLVHVNCSGRTQEEIAALEPCLVAALRQLPRLEHLEFIECGIVGQFGLPYLPSNLRSLTLTNCHRVFSPNLEAYLESHGRQLRELSLSHNRHLKMTFSTRLAEYCPNLERFKMDVSMHDWSSYRDSSLHFDELLTSSEVPTWPETLREIELIQLTKLSETTVEGFFMSLVNAAPRLRDLRRLTITAILKIGWRDRATFRERWIRRLQTTFLRRSAPPDPNLRSLRKRPLYASQPLADGESARPNSAGSEPSTPSKRQSVRLAQLKDSLSRSPSPAPHEEIQRGMCNYVKIRIDNQRPTETQFNEADFLDDELSGDEDWAGDDWEPPQRHAW